MVGVDRLIDRHKGQAAVVACHGPSLNFHKDKIEKMQEAETAIRFSTNNWYDFFSCAPSYWVLASTVDTVRAHLDKINECGASILFADSVDLTDYSFIEQSIKNEYMGYDQRHFKGHRCIEILKNAKSFYEENKTLTFTGYGNNSVMWQPPRFGGREGWAGFDLFGRCCGRIVEGRPTVQEELQRVSDYNEHYSSGDTVALHMIAFAVIMGCSPIYISGMDLDYREGYANDQAVPVNDDWQRLNANLVNDLRIINESAKKRGIKIINLKPDAWYSVFEEGEL